MHDAGVRVFETFVGRAQVTVRVELQDGEFRMALGQRVQVAQRRAVVAAQHHHAFASIEQVTGFGFQPLQHFVAFCRGLGGHGFVLFTVGFGLAFFQPANVLGGQGPQFAAGFGYDFVLILYGQTELPGVGHVRIVQVDLQRGFADSGRASSRAGPVAHRYLPRHGYYYYLCLLRREGQAEQAAINIARRVGVEGGYFLS